MTPDQFFAQLGALAAGREVNSAAVVNFLYEKLLNQEHESLNALYGELVLHGTMPLLLAFNGLMDMFCVEPLGATQPQGRQWRTFAITSLMRQPESLHIAILSDTAPIRRWLSEHLEIPESSIRVDPVPVSALAAYAMGPAEVFARCNEAKLWASNPQYLRAPCAENTLTAPAGAEHVTEVLILVSILCSVNETEDVMSGLVTAATAQPALELPLKTNSQTDALTVGLMPVDAGGGWSLFDDALHTADTAQTGAALRQAARERGEPMSAFTLVAVCVEGEDDHMSLRVSVVHTASQTLCAGVEVREAHEPHLYIQKVDRLLEGLGLSPLQVIPQTYFDAEVDTTPGVPRFFVPRHGWLSLD